MQMYVVSQGSRIMAYSLALLADSGGLKLKFSEVTPIVVLT